MEAVKPGDIFRSTFGEGLYLVVSPDLVRGWRKGELLAMLLTSEPGFPQGMMFRFGAGEVAITASDVQFVPVPYEDKLCQWPRGRPFVVSMDGTPVVIAGKMLDIRGEPGIPRSILERAEEIDIGLFDLGGKHVYCYGGDGRIDMSAYEVYDIIAKFDQAA